MLGEQMNKKAPLLILLVVFSSISTTIVLAEDDTELIANLVLQVDSNDLILQDIAYKIAEQLAEINIIVEVKIESDWNWFPWGISRDWDMKVTETDSLSFQNMRSYYTEDGENNIFGLSTEMPYGNDSENMQNELVTIEGLEEKNLLITDWITLFMDKITPLLPLYSPRHYVASWANLLGYESRWSIADCLPYMEFDFLH